MTSSSSNEREKRESPLSIRLPNDLKAALEDARRQSGQSLNKEIATRLEASFKAEAPELAALKFVADELPRRINWLIGTDDDTNRAFLLLFYRATLNTLFDELSVGALGKEDVFQTMADAAAKKLIADMRSAMGNKANNPSPEQLALAQAGHGLGLHKEGKK